MAFFRFLDLPQEIQDNIYAKYFEDIAPAFRARTDCDWECTYGDAEVGFPDHDFAVIGKPNLAIDLVSRKVCGDARTARNKDMSRTLVIGKLTCDADGDIGAFCFDPKYFWLRNHIETLVFDKCLQGNFELVAPIVAQFPSVRNVEVRALTPFSTEDCTPDHLRETSSHVMMTGQERSDGMYADWSELEHLAKDRPELSIKLVSSVFLRHTERSILWTSVHVTELLGLTKTQTKFDDSMEILEDNERLWAYTAGCEAKQFPDIRGHTFDFHYVRDHYGEVEEAFEKGGYRREDCMVG